MLLLLLEDVLGSVEIELEPFEPLALLLVDEPDELDEPDEVVALEAALCTVAGV